MGRYIVSVELENTSKTSSLQSVVRNISKDFIQIQPNVWICLSDKNVVEIRDLLFQTISKKDRLFIGELTSNYEGLFDANDSDYLRQRIYRR